jgi:hypothetical protein
MVTVAKARTIHFILLATFRITLVSKVSIRQLEHHVYDRRRIDCLPIARGGLKMHFVCGVDGGFIQAMAQTADHTVYVQLPICAELYFEQNFAFEFQIPSLVGIKRIRLGGDFDCGWLSNVDALNVRRILRDLL